VFFQHFRGTLDDHDPALSDAFASDREVILFDNTGVASSRGTVPDTIGAMARDAITLTGALGLNAVDLVGHSMGGLVAQEVVLARPDLVRRISQRYLACDLLRIPREPGRHDHRRRRDHRDHDQR
jgi:pimeloyl-ACP methyl ester carboxylesterase